MRWLWDTLCNRVKNKLKTGQYAKRPVYGSFRDLGQIGMLINGFKKHVNQSYFTNPKYM
jgi:hypothetical protein